MSLVLEFPNLFYIVEIKLNKSAKNALKQVTEKEYFQPFLHSEKPVRLLGLNFIHKTQKQAGKQAHFTITTESKPWIS